MTDQAPSADRQPRRPVASSWLLLALLAVGYAWLFPWSERINNPNEMVRVYMARAIAEHGTYAIGRREVVRGESRDTGPIYSTWGYVNDKALTCDDPTAKRPDCNGTLYAGKAPGLSQLGAVPLWMQLQLWRLAGQDAPSKAAMVWWLRLWTAVIPSILAWFWLFRTLPKRLDRPEIGVAAVLAGAFGSLSLTYGQMFAGHQLAGLALLLAFAALQRAGSSGHGPWLAVAGFGSAAAAWIEFPAGPAGIVLFAWALLRRHRPSDLLWLGGGAALPVAALGHFNARAFGAPWKLPYGFLENPDFVRDIAPGVFGIHLPNAEKLVGSLISPYTGLYFWAPWVALTWLGIAAVRRRYAEPQATESQGGFWFSRRADALVAWGVVLYFVAFQCSHSLWRGGWVVGPRYITALVPFAAIATAHGIDALRGPAQRIALIVLGISGAVAIAITGAATAVSQGFPFEVYNPLAEVVGPLLSRGWVWSSPPYWLGMPLMAAALPWFAALALAAAWLIWASSSATSGSRRSVITAGMALIAAAWVAGLWAIPPHRGTQDIDKTNSFLTDSWWPSSPRGPKPVTLAPP